MKDELQLKLVEILGSIQTAAGKAGDFAMTQLPDIAQQYVVYGRFISLAKLVLCVLSFAAICRLFRWTYIRVTEDCMDEVVWIPVGVAGGIAGVLAVLGAFASVNSAALVWFAPKVWLLKEIAGLIK